MSSARSSARLPNISLLDTGLFAGLVFLLLGGILLFGRTRESGEGTALGEVKLENLPGNSSSCWAPLDAQGNGGCVISLNERNELAFALREVGNNFHVRVINQLAIQHGVVLNPSALAELKALPFLTCDIEKLPLLLNAPRWQRTQLIQVLVRLSYPNALPSSRLMLPATCTSKYFIT